MILLMGLPGAGKGTQGKMIADECGLHLISMGDLVRMYVTGQRRQEMLRGKLLADQEIIALLDQVLRTVSDDDECILDGFPRTIPQAEWLFKQVEAGRFNVSLIIHLRASREALKARLLGRGRTDDNENVIDARFREYETLTAPLLEWYKGHGWTVTDVDGERSVNEIHDDLIKLYKEAR